jgi:tetratricopeptide (TPR) repeat protein
MRILILSLLLSSFGLSQATAQTAPEQIALGDKAYSAFHAAEALSHYEKAMAADPRSYEALWKASRSAVDIGSYDPESSRRATLYASAEQYARRAVAVDPGDAEGHFALARALGKTALVQSPKARIRYATEIRSEALECLRLNPRHGGCLHVMGMWNAEVMRLNGFTRMVARNLLGGKVFGTANWKEAVRYMEASVASDPDRIVHHVDLADIYRDIGEKAKARREWDTVLRLPIADVNDKAYKEQARRALGTK